MITVEQKQHLLMLVSASRASLSARYDAQNRKMSFETRRELFEIDRKAHDELIGFIVSMSPNAVPLAENLEGE